MTPDGGKRITEQLTPDEVRRYSRHLLLPEIGMQGQKKLKEGSVLVVGAGGLGSPVLLYLAAAGLGNIGIVENDIVEETNLQRQVIFSTDDIGKSKLDIAFGRLTNLNPHILIDKHPVRLEAGNALQIIRNYKVVVDCTDNFPTRYLINDACVLSNIPYVYGSVFRFEGQISVFSTVDGPCYRCLYPEPPPPDTVPNCAEGGVLGILPGIMGAMQATEVIKIITGIGEVLAGRVLLFNALEMKFREIKLNKNPECTVCGTKPTIRTLINYQQFCGVPMSWNTYKRDSEHEIDVHELKILLDSQNKPDLLDVREAHEREICNIGGRHIPLRELSPRTGELNRDKDIVIYCKMGGRSRQAVEILLGLGFTRVRNLVGGIDAWAREIDPGMSIY
jgi:sulfur-carrier protein adenylyltransferase/sulfurtransferase